MKSSKKVSKSKVKITIDAKPVYKIGEPITIKIKITNKSDQDLKILKWGTPFEELRSDIFEVTRSKKESRVPFQGLHINRWKPTKKDFIVIKKGKSVTVKNRLTNVYLFNKPGRYRVRLKENFIYTLNRKKLEKSIIRIDSVEFKIVGSEKNFKKTIGLRHRRQELKKMSAIVYSENYLLSDSIYIWGDDEEKRRIVTESHFMAREILDKLLSLFHDQNSSLGNLLEEWFGIQISSPQMLDDVYYLLSNVHHEMFSGVVMYDITGGDLDASNLYGYVYEGSETIYLGGKFWTAPDRGFDSKFGTLIHELTHLYGGSEDFSCHWLNSRTDCSRHIARNHFDIAIRSANNYEHFIEDFDTIPDVIT